MARKTVNLTAVLDHANGMLAATPDDMRPQREGIAALLESLLHDAGVYAGFGYTEKAGIDHDAWEAAWERHRAIAEIRKANGIEGWNNDQPRWENYCADDSRRCYYRHRSLR